MTKITSLNWSQTILSFPYDLFFIQSLMLSIYFFKTSINNTKRISPTWHTVLMKWDLAIDFGSNTKSRKSMAQ